MSPKTTGPKAKFGGFYNLNARTITAPLAAFCMASILFVYARTSIQAAKRNAQKHREADGGQINWHNENLRRHGKLETPTESSTISEIVGTIKEGTPRRRKNRDNESKPEISETESEKKLRELREAQRRT